MKSSFRGFVLALMAMVCLTALMPAALAENGLTAGPIGVEITLSGTRPYPAETYNVRLTALDDAYPMPEGASEGVYELKITGEGTGELPEITYEHVGVYKYTITQAEGDNPRCTYDKRVYNVTIYVINLDQGGIGNSIAIYEGDKTDKVQNVVFNNRYPTIVVPTPSPTPSPTPTPTATPTAEPTATPTAEPTPTVEPTATPEPTDEPTARPTQRPTHKPTTPPGDITETGVTDRWPLYAAGCAALLVAAFFIVKSLRRKEDTGDGSK